MTTDKTVDDPCPAYFYKYRAMSSPEDVKRVEQIVLGNELFFASAKSFNDPFDLNPSISLEAPTEAQRDDFIRLSRKFNPGLTEDQRGAAADEIIRAGLSDGDIGITENMMKVLLRQALIESVGTFCVTEKRDDLLMWAHYADSHRGVCLEFDGMLKLMAHAQRVNYSPVRSPINRYTDDQNASVTKALLTKSNHWAYEAEWRLLRVGNGPGTVPFRAENLTGIVVGALASRETIRIVGDWAAKRLVPLKLYRAKTSNSEFRLLIEPLRRN